MKLLKLSIVLLVFAVCFCPAKSKLVANAQRETSAIVFDFVFDNKSIKFNSFDICANKDLLKKWNRTAGGKEAKKTCDKILKMGFSYTTCAQFLFPGMEQVFDALEQKINRPPQNAKLVFAGSTKTIASEVFGKKFDREKTAQKLIENLSDSTNKIEVAIDKIEPQFCYADIANCACLKGKFSTWCGSSSLERKNNIKVALRALDGIQILPGETFSFNSTTGSRTEEKGYKKAKIISNGKYVEGTGGGVCQVSTTLYNAALLSGLEIAEVHQHSLPVSYVEPSRDAMVSGYSSDLKIKNNGDMPVFINAVFANEQDIVIKIYGQKNDLTYSVESKVIKTIETGSDEIVKDKSLAPIELKKGEEYRISAPKNGVESESFLIEKDKSGKTIRRTKIRHNKYNPTKGVVVVG